MKKVIEERRNEAYTSRPDGAEEPHDQQVHQAKFSCKVNCCCNLSGMLQESCSRGETESPSDHDVAPVLVSSCFLFQEKRLSDLSNQSHDSQVSNSTLSANSHEDRHNVSAPSQREDLVDGHSPQEEEELDEMEVEYIEVSIYDVIDSTQTGITNSPDNNPMMPPFT